ncbi:MAG TPA: crossover junction endodeoxyribonuclease RuvC [Spirochaetales bacterium]|nr:crossover junction endodeoxyribonuclease RuvC [Spirochaetales bacterium]HOV38228.1 crossover junction endodeoxyribonuclease RuvC [Spirochaetales bacterium]
MIRILGLDPGLAETGYGIIEEQGGRYVHVCHGVISTPASMELGERLQFIYQDIQNLISTYDPEEAGVETLYFARNATSAIPVAEARGVALLALAQAGLTTGSYPPQAIKQAIVGHGKAEKRQVQELVRILLGLETIPKPDHAADALAAAICHANSRGSPLHV